MPYIGNPIYQAAFVTDQFSGTGSQTAYTMSVAPAGTTNVLVVVSGVVQDPSTYGVVGNTLTFSAAPPSGTGNISCRYLGVPATGVTTTAYRTVTEFTATASQTTFTPPSYNVGFINVYRNGVLLGSADYTATNGTTVVLATGATAGDLVTVESFQISSVANAIPNAAGSVSNSNLAGDSVTTAKIANGSVTPAKLSTGGLYWSSAGNVGIGTTGPASGSNPGTLAVQTTQDFGISIYRSATSPSQIAFLDNNNSCAIGTDGNSSMVFYNNSRTTERMRIDSSGRVTMPYQPSFWANTSGCTRNATTGVVQGYPTPFFNVGSAFNTTTGYFTAPIAGLYAFTGSKYNNANAGGIIYLYVNNAQRAYNDFTIAQNTHLTVTLYYKLAAGDTVAMGISSTMLAGDANDYFGGYLAS